jgi:predicted AlkP superfamily phosphohydrolase/phosphomutase
MILNSSIPLWIFGLDTGDVEMIRHWVRQGHLPAIGSLLGRGCWAVVSGPEMVAEYGAALTLFSGVSRADHGYYYMRQLQPGTYNLVRVDPEDVQGAPPFWAHLAGANRRVLIIDVPDIALVPGLPGFQISNWGTHHSPRDPATEPPELLREVLEVAGPRIRADVEPDSTFEKDQQLLQTWRQRAKARGKLCRRLLQEGSFDLINITFSETDPATTQFWKYREDAKGQGRVPGTSLRHAIRETFEVIDRELASLLALLPSEANVILYCLYGQEDNYPPCTLTEEFCRKLGYHVARPPAPGSFRLLDLARRFVPQSIRLRISRRLPAGMQENLLASQLLGGTDWSQTRAFAIPSLYTGFIRVNLRGREPQGIVSSGQEYRRLLDDLENDLRQLQDPVDGQSAVRRGEDRADRHHFPQSPFLQCRLGTKIQRVKPVVETHHAQDSGGAPRLQYRAGAGFVHCQWFLDIHRQARLQRSQSGLRMQGRGQADNKGVHRGAGQQLAVVAKFSSPREKGLRRLPMLRLGLGQGGDPAHGHAPQLRQVNQLRNSPASRYPQLQGFQTPARHWHLLILYRGFGTPAIRD